MSMNEFTYLAVTKVREAELEARAAQDQLVRAARAAAEERRAARREARRLQAAVAGRRPGPLSALRAWFAPERPIAETTGTSAGEVTEHAPETADKAGVGHSTDAEARELINAGC